MKVVYVGPAATILEWEPTGASFSVIGGCPQIAKMMFRMANCSIMRDVINKLCVAAAGKDQPR